MALRKIRLELARSAERGYAFAAPRADHGCLAARGWRARREACSVHRFRTGEDDAYRHLAHHRGHQWAFRYDDMSEEDEPIFGFDGQSFVLGQSVSITEHDGVPRTCRAGVCPVP